MTDNKCHKDDTIELNNMLSLHVVESLNDRHWLT